MLSILNYMFMIWKINMIWFLNSNEWYELLLSKSWDQLKLNTKKHEDELSEDNKHALLKICQIWAELFYMLAWKWDHKIFAIIMKNIKKALESKSYTNS